MLNINSAFETARNQFLLNGNLLDCSNIFKGLNDKEKNYVILFFLDSNISQKSIARICNISEPAISQRLRIMRKKRFSENINRINELVNSGVPLNIISDVFEKHGVSITPDQIKSVMVMQKELVKIDLDLNQKAFF